MREIALHGMGGGVGGGITSRETNSAGRVPAPGPQRAEETPEISSRTSRSIWTPDEVMTRTTFALDRSARRDSSIVESGTKAARPTAGENARRPAPMTAAIIDPTPACGPGTVARFESTPSISAGHRRLVETVDADHWPAPPPALGAELRDPRRLALERPVVCEPGRITACGPGLLQVHGLVAHDRPAEAFAPVLCERAHVAA